MVLLGNYDDHDTIEPGPGVDIPSRWVSRYLNTRYFEFPDGIAVRAREGWRADPDSSTNQPRLIHGQKNYLDDNSEASGLVDLSEYRVRWWLLKDRESRAEKPEFAMGGHFAGLFRGELYEMRTGRAGMSTLQQFGVIFGHDRVALYVEPRNGSSARISSNTARTILLRDGKALPLADWAAEFRAQMPQGIRDHIDAVISGTGSSSHRDSIKERLKNYEKLYRLSRYRPRAGGSFRTEDPRSGNRRGPRMVDRQTSSASPEGTRRQVDKTGALLSSMLADGGQAADRVEKGLDLPHATWVSREAGTRAEGEIEDRAARFLREDNLIKINADFRVFTDMIEFWCRDRGVEPGNQVIVDIVHDWFEQALVETVIGCQALQGAQRWDPEELDRASLRRR